PEASASPARSRSRRSASRSPAAGRRRARTERRAGSLLDGGYWTWNRLGRGGPASLASQRRWGRPAPQATAWHPICLGGGGPVCVGLCVGAAVAAIAFDLRLEHRGHGRSHMTAQDGMCSWTHGLFL